MPMMNGAATSTTIAIIAGARAVHGGDRAAAAVLQHLRERALAVEAVRGVVDHLVALAGVQLAPAAIHALAAVAKIRMLRGRRRRSDERRVDGRRPRLAART